MTPDGNFTHAKSSNPEDKLALIDAIEIAKKNNSDLVIGTDPDADRFGIVVKDFNDDFIQINGNQSMIWLDSYSKGVSIESLLQQGISEMELEETNFMQMKSTY